MYRSPLPLLGLCASLGALPALAQGQERIVINTKSATATASASCGEQTLPWIAQSPEGSTLNGQAAPLEGSLTVTSSGQSGFAFHITEADTAVRIELDGQDKGDPVVKLLDASGQVLGENDDFGSSLSSRLDISLQPGTYCAVGASLGDDFEGLLQIGLEAHPPRISGEGVGNVAACTPDIQGQPLTSGPLEAAMAAGAVNQSVMADAPQYLRFTLGAPTSLTLKASANELDPKIALFDAKGEILAENDDDGTSTNSRLDFPDPLPAGDYCLGVIALQASEGQIRVEAEKLDREAFLMAAYKRGELVPSASSGYKIEAFDLKSKEPTVALLGKDALWYSFDLDRETVVMITAYGKLAGADTKLALFDSRGQPISENDDTSAGTDAQLGPLLLTAGSYRMVLTDLQQAEGGSARPTLLNADLFYRAE